MDFHFTITTDKSIQEAIESVETSLQNHKFGVLWKLDIPATLKNKGVEADFKFHVFEVCNPGIAKEFFTSDLMVGYFLPCRVVVYEKDGRTHIGIVKPTAILGLVNDELPKLAQPVEEKLILAIQEAK